MVIEDIDAAVQLIKMQLSDIDKIHTKAPYGLEYSFWEDFTAKIIDRIYGEDSRQRHGFEQAGRGGCFSVFESYSDHQRRDDFMEILNCKKEFLEHLIKDLNERRNGFKTSETGKTESYDSIMSFEENYEVILKSQETSPLDRAVAEILFKIKDPALLKEAKANLILLRCELYKNSPSWAKLKKPLTWLIEYGKDEFFYILPFVVLYMRKIVE